MLETLNKFFDHEERPSLTLLDQDLPNIVKLLEEKRDANVIIYCSKIISYLADGYPQTVQVLLRLGAKGRLMQLLSHSDEAVVVSVLRASRYLVPPKVSTNSRLVTISPIKMSKCSVPLYEQWTVSPLMPSTQGFCNEMTPVDILACQNTEMFMATEQDITSQKMMDHTFHGNITVGQIGIRCIHCATNSERTVQCATIFPGKTITCMFSMAALTISLISPCIYIIASLGRMALSLRQMGWYHFPSCPFLPLALKKRFSQLTQNSVSAFECMDTLEHFCFSVCEKMGVDNNYPPKSGIMLKKTEEQCETFQQPIALPFEMIPMDHLALETSPTKSQAKTNNEKPVDSEFKSIDSAPPLYNRLITTECEKENAMFQKARKGVWQCMQCAENNIRVPTSIWEGDMSPPAAFIAKHAKECPGARAMVKSVMVQSPSVPANTVSAQLHPAHHNYQELNTSPQTAAPMSSQKNGISASETHKTGLVLSEDKELLTDYILITLEQLQECRLESNKNRYALPEGFPGLECKHCAGTKTARRFFWSCPQRFKNNNSEFSKHLLRCGHCPDSVKQQISFTKSYHFIQMKKLPRGSLTIFFRRLFRRLHASNDSSKGLFDTGSENTFFESRNDLLPFHEPFPTPPSPPRETKFLSSVDAPSMDLASYSMIMSLPGDADWLSEKECYLRENIELFCSTATDLKIISSSSDDRFPNEGQVGLRCVHCSKSLPCKGLSNTETYAFPNKVQNIRTCLISLQEHLSNCQYAPALCRKTFEIPLKNCCLQVTRDYYNETLDRLGFVNGRLKGVYARATCKSIISKKQVNENIMSGKETDAGDSPLISRGPIITPSLSGNKRIFEML